MILNISGLRTFRVHRYLAVDTSVPVKAEENGLMERWYSMLLVDDESMEGGDEADGGESMQT